jgi:L-cysteine:1D-myo-inositol 2-amino-2-deoxy-alpha-D-glucopyranoside ligase
VSELISKWPTVAIPATSLEMPTLKLRSTSGSFELPSESQPFKMYVCGITPYDATHLGHAATYLTFDLINRFLQLAGKKVSFVENVTDIDDPLFERARRDHKSWKDLGDSQVALFATDMTALRILPPKDFVSVTAAMNLIITAIENLVANEWTYALAGNVYFRISQFLAELPVSAAHALTIFAERGGDPQTHGKENQLDPILWVANKDGEPGWNSLMGFGRPGWHVECSVIALNNLVGADYLSSTKIAPEDSFEIDLQGGGTDLIFPHHFMTAAIGKALTGREFARSYVHAGMVGLDGEKMSKSKGNLVLVSNLLNRGVDPMEIRYALLSEHYSSDRMWSEDTLTKSKVNVADLRSALSRNEVAATDRVISGIASSLADDLNSPLALEILERWVSDTQNGGIGGSVGELSRFIDAALGLAL